MLKITYANRFPLCVPSPFKLPCSRITVPFTVRRPESELPLQPDLRLKGPLILKVRYQVSGPASLWLWFKFSSMCTYIFGKIAPIIQDTLLTYLAIIQDTLFIFFPDSLVCVFKIGSWYSGWNQVGDSGWFVRVNLFAMSQNRRIGGIPS